MKITEQSDTRLAFTIGIPYFNATQCDFDRTSGRATIKRVMLFWPLKTVDVPLGEVSSVQLAGGSYQAGQYYKAYPIVVLNSGRQIKFAAFQESASKKAVAAVQAFLQRT